jgi:hypothetical protein
MIVTLIGVAVVFAAWVLARVNAARRQKGHRFPAGPKASWIPFVGNGLELLQAKIPFASLAMELADNFKDEILMLDSFGTKIVLLNTPRVCKDVSKGLLLVLHLLSLRQLFEIRGSIYSSRAPAPLLRGVICRNSTISFEPHNDTWVWPLATQCYLKP